MRTSLAAALLLAAASAWAAPAAKTEKKTGARSAMEWNNGGGGPAESGHEIIGDAAAWAALWKKRGLPAPALDLAKFAAVAVYAGERPTGGYVIEFLEPRKDGPDLIARYKIKAPTGMVTQAFTSPWAVKAFPKPKGRLRVEAEPEEAR